MRDEAEPSGHNPGVTTNPTVSSEDVEQSFSQLVGMKCRAPFSHDWGEFSYHNGLILSVNATEDEAMPKVGRI